MRDDENIVFRLLGDTIKAAWTVWSVIFDSIVWIIVIVLFFSFFGGIGGLIVLVGGAYLVRWILHN